MKIKSNLMRLLKDRKDYLLACLFFSVIILIFLYRIFLGEVYSPANAYYNWLPWSNEYTLEGTHGVTISDPIDSIWPSMYAIRQSAFGIPPLWIPNAALGYPAGADAASYILNPLYWACLVLPIQIASTVDIMIRLFVGLLGMYTLLRGLKMRHIPGLVGSIIFIFSAPMIYWLNWPHTRVGVLAPWLLWSVIKILRDDCKHVIVSAILISLMIMSGMPAYAAYFLYLILFYAALIVLLRAIELYDLRIILKKGIQLGIAVISGLLLSMPHVLPFLQTLSFTEYVKKRSDANIFSGHLKLGNLLQIFDAQYYKTNLYTQHPNEIACYFGIGSVIMVICAIVIIFCKKEKKFYFFPIAAIVLFGCAWGVPGFNLLGLLPLAGSSMASRLIMPAVFVAAILAAKAVDVMSEQIPKKIWRGAIGIAISSVVSMFALGVLGLSKFELTSNLLISMVVLILTIYLLFLLQYKKINYKVFSVVILFVFTFDVLHGALDYNPSVEVSKSTLNPQTELTDFLKKQEGNVRHATLSNDIWILFPNSGIYYGVNNLASHNFIMPYSRLKKYFLAIDDDSYDTATRTSFKNMSDVFLTDLASTKYILTDRDKYTFESVRMSSGNNSPVGEITQGVLISQTIKPKQNRLAAIDIKFATYGKKLTAGSINWEIKDATGNAIRSGNFDNSQLIDNQNYRIFFQAIDGSKEEKYTLNISSFASHSDQAPTIWRSNADTYPDGKLYINGALTHGDILFQMGYENQLFGKLKHIGEKSGLDIYESPTALPRAYMVNDVRVNKNQESILSDMVTERKYATAYIEKEAPFPVQSNPHGTEIVEVDSLDVNPNEVTIQTSSKQDSLLVLTDLYYPGWKVFIDGVESEIYCTNYLFRGVFVHSGKHVVEFIYRPMTLFVGLAIAACTWLIMAIWSVKCFCNTRRNSK